MSCDSLLSFTSRVEKFEIRKDDQWQDAGKRALYENIQHRVEMFYLFDICICIYEIFT